MGTHVRTLTRQQAVDALKSITYLDAQGIAKPLQVFESRTYPTDANDLPCACLYSPEDVVTEERETGRRPGNRIMRRSIRLTVPLFFGKPARLRNTLEAQAEAVLLQMENAMAASFLFPGPGGVQVATKATYGGMKSALVDDGSIELIAFVSTWTVLVFHPELDASVALPMKH